jgi:hypothetical protein
VAIPSRVLGSGINSLSTVSICGDGAGAVTAAGTSAGNATELTHVYNNVSTVGSSEGVKLPPTELGETIIVRNGGANPLTVYPYDTAAPLTRRGRGNQYGSSALFFAVSNTVWESMQGFGRNCSEKALRCVFSDTTLQTAASTNVAYGMTYTTDSLQWRGDRFAQLRARCIGIRVSTTLQFSAQVDATSWRR